MSTKINQLLKELPERTPAHWRWFAAQGVSKQLLHQYVRSGWLNRVAHGVYARTDADLPWSGAVLVLQKHLSLPIHVAARTALELKGLAHDVPLGSEPLVWLHGPRGTKLPGWAQLPIWHAQFRYQQTGMLSPFREGDDSFTTHDFGSYGVAVASAERAALELCQLAPQQESFEALDNALENLVSLRPSLLQSLLEQCRSIKAKRLFLFLAERHQHPWLSHVDVSRVDLGSGKRTLLRGGKLEPKSQLVLPPELLEAKGSST